MKNTSSIKRRIFSLVNLATAAMVVVYAFMLYGFYRSLVVIFSGAVETL